jgi:hypothetical protein
LWVKRKAQQIGEIYTKAINLESIQTTVDYLHTYLFTSTQLKESDNSLCRLTVGFHLGLFSDVSKILNCSSKGFWPA